MESVSGRHAVNRRRQQSGGVSEGKLHVSSGLRNDPFAIHLQSKMDHIATLIPGAAAQPLSDITDPTTWNGTISQTILPYPSSVCISFACSVVVASARVLRTRITGLDQFGDVVQETMTMTIPNGLELHNDDTASKVHYSRQWTSRIFSKITQIEMEKTLGNLLDVIFIGTCHKWDVADGEVWIYHDHNANTYTLDVTIGGATLTTAAIQHNASADDMRAALEALASISDVTVTKPTVSVPAGLTQAYLIQFNNPVLGREAIAVSNNTLAGGTFIQVTGEYHNGRENDGIGLPVEVLTGSPPIGTDLFPDILHCQLLIPKEKGSVTTIGIASTTAATDTVTLASPHGYQVGEVFLVVLNEVTGLTPATNLVAVATAVSDVSFTINVDINTVGAVGEASFEQSLVDGVVQLYPNPGTKAVPTGAGFRAGISAAGYAGDANKISPFLDGNSGFSLTDHHTHVVRLNHATADIRGPEHILWVWPRTRKGDGVMATDQRRYPLPY